MVYLRGVDFNASLGSPLYIKSLGQPISNENVFVESSLAIVL